MTAIEGKLCSTILREHFSEIVQKVANCLFRNGKQSLQFVRMSTKLPLDEVKKCLCLLIKFGYVLHEKNDKGSMMYKLDHNAVIMTLRYPRFMHLVKLNSGDDAEMMLEEILKQGYELASQIIIKTHQRILEKTKQEPTFPSLIKSFELLTKNEYIMRCTATHEQAQSVPFKPDYTLPNLNLNALEKISRGEISDTGDAGIYWKVNFDRFVQDLRDGLVVKTAKDQIDEMAGELMRQLLILSYQRTSGWEKTLNPVPLTEIREQVKKHSTQPRLGQYLEQYTRLLEDEFSRVNDIQKVLKRVGDSSGGQYSIDMKEAFAQLTESTLQSIVKERYGSNAARLFSVILSHSHIKLEKLQGLTMINPKESKMLVFRLLHEKFIRLEELREPKASLTSPSIYLCTTDINSIVRMEISYCYQAIYNMNQRRNHETISNKRVIDKYLRLQAIKNNMMASGAEEEKVNEIDEMMTPAEYQDLERTNIKIRVLAGAEFKAEETLFILSMYLRYH